MDSDLRNLIARVLKVAPETLAPDSGPGTIPAWDSAAHMALVMELERTYGVQFDDDAVAALVSPDAIARALTGMGVSLG